MKFSVTSFVILLGLFFSVESTCQEQFPGKTCEEISFQRTSNGATNCEIPDSCTVDDCCGYIMNCDKVPCPNYADGGNGIFLSCNRGVRTCSFDLCCPQETCAEDKPFGCLDVDEVSTDVITCENKRCGLNECCFTPDLCIPPIPDLPYDCESVGKVPSGKVTCDSFLCTESECCVDQTGTGEFGGGF